MNADPDPDRGAAQAAGPGVQLTLNLDRRTNRVFGTGEGDHEPVALRLHDMPAVPADAFADDLVVGAECPEPGLVAKLLIERCGVLDVREET